jgi:hypothetical protein
MNDETFSLEEAARNCLVHPFWTRDSSWFIARTFHECRFRREKRSIAEALHLRACWHTVACARFDSGSVVVDGGGQRIREIDPAELPRPVTLMACSVGIALSKRPDKFGRFESELRDPDDLMVMDGNHRLAGLAMRRRNGQPDVVSEIIVYVCR